MIRIPLFDFSLGYRRGDLLRMLKERGCTIRGMARDLGKSETTLRRYMMLSAQPPEERQRFKDGETAKRILARKAIRDR